MAYHYVTPTEGNGRDEPLRPAHEDELAGDPANYNRHYIDPEGGIAQRCVIASRVRLGTYEDYAEDPNSDVETLDNPDEDRYPAPSADDGEDEG